MHSALAENYKAQNRPGQTFFCTRFCVDHSPEVESPERGKIPPGLKMPYQVRRKLRRDCYAESNANDTAESRPGQSDKAIYLTFSLRFSNKSGAKTIVKFIFSATPGISPLRRPRRALSAALTGKKRQADYGLGRRWPPGSSPLRLGARSEFHTGRKFPPSAFFLGQYAHK